LDIGAHHTDFTVSGHKKMNDASSPWWDRARHADRRGRLMARGRIKLALASHLSADDFTEVECGQLQVSPGNETHLHAFATQQLHPDGSGRPLYLHTSPEFACKKLLAAGETRIFDFARVFRNREAGALHAPEFTMLEWFRVGEPYEALMADCAAFLRLACASAGTDRLRWRGRQADPALAPERLTLRAAFLRHAGLDLVALAERDAFAAAAGAIGIRIAADDTWSDIFSRVLSEKIEPHLGIGRATILCEYPASEAALARPKPDDPTVAERFELYACGVELANAFGELTDAREQRRRFEADMAEKNRIYGERYPLDEDFLAALAVMPEASGAALGFDRLVMLACGASHISQVQWTPFPVAGEA
jgi:lysyl-tRNA synthetase class 2